jgi:hypothetical protein
MLWRPFSWRGEQSELKETSDIPQYNIRIMKQPLSQAFRVGVLRVRLTAPLRVAALTDQEVIYKYGRSYCSANRGERHEPHSSVLPCSFNCVISVSLILLSSEFIIW